MSKQAFEAFKSKVSEDPTLRGEMVRVLSAGGTKKTASVAELCAFAKTQGYEVIPDDVRENVELSDDELNAVAGGAAVDYYLKIDGVSGETADTNYVIQFNQTDFSWVRRF